MIERRMPSPEEYDTEPSKYAGQDPDYENQTVMSTDSGKRVIILQYLKSEGLYVVTNVDEPGTRSSAYKINPDKLIKIDQAEEK